MNEEQQKIMTDAGHFALGWIIAKHGTDSAGAYFLANALKKCGSESHYVDAVLKDYENKTAFRRAD